MEMTGFDKFNGMYSYGEQTSVTRLTLSAEAQIAAYQALEGKKGTVAVYNYRTGQILCAVSTPTFDPDNLPELNEENAAEFEGMYMSRFTDGLYTPGSIFKVLTLAVALETVPDITEQTFTCEGAVEFGPDKVTCERRHYNQDLQTAFRNSCNCAFAQIALQVGPENLEKYAKLWGITEELTFDGITTQKGRYKAVGQADVNVAWSGIGQFEDLINPCSFLAFIGAIANDGMATAPHVVDAILVDEEVTYQPQLPEGQRILSRDTAKLLQTYLRSNVTDGYGADRFGSLPVCAKTGTAQVDGQDKPNAMLVGFSTDPDNPLAFIVCVENAGYGAEVGIPIAKQVLEACIE